MSDTDKNGIPLEIVRAAAKDPHLRGRVLLCSVRREPLRCDGLIVGFVSPRQRADGAWRHGPIYILPAYRKRGVLADYYAAHPERTCISFVADANKESRRAHKAAGFIDWRRHRAGWFMRREALA